MASAEPAGAAANESREQLAAAGAAGAVVLLLFLFCAGAASVAFRLSGFGAVCDPGVRLKQFLLMFA